MYFKGHSLKTLLAILVLAFNAGPIPLTEPARASGASGASGTSDASGTSGLFQSSSFDDDCFKQFFRRGRPKRTLFLDHGLQAGPITALHTSLGYRFWERHMLLLTYQVGRQEYDSDYMIPMCRECVFFFHSLWLGYGFEFVRPLAHGSGLFLNPLVHGGSEFVPNRGLLPWSNSAFIMNPALRPEIVVGYYRRKIDIFVGLNYTYWFPIAATIKGNALVDEQTGQPLEWDRELFPGRKGFNGFVGIRYTIF
jgi:hypothetical protein